MHNFKDLAGFKEREHLSFERILFFSDAVFAISITLLVLEMKVPAIQEEYSELQLGYALLHMAPKFVGFLVSFFLIGQTWIEHHRICSFLGEFNFGMLWRNLWLLLFVAFLPFAIGLMSEYYFSRIAISVYAFSFAGLGLAKASFWHYAVKKHLLAKDINTSQANRIGRPRMGNTDYLFCGHPHDRHGDSLFILWFCLHSTRCTFAGLNNCTKIKH